MLYQYNGKIYVRPFSNKIIEVKVEKKGEEYNVVALPRYILIDNVIATQLVAISVEKAYREMNKVVDVEKKPIINKSSKNSKMSRLLDKKIDLD